MFLVLPNERGIQGMEIWLNRCGALERGAYASPPLALHEAAAGEEGDAPSKPIPPPPPPPPASTENEMQIFISAHFRSSLPWRLAALLATRRIKPS